MSKISIISKPKRFIILNDLVKWYPDKVNIVSYNGKQHKIRLNEEFNRKTLEKLIPYKYESNFNFNSTKEFFDNLVSLIDKNIVDPKESFVKKITRNKEFIELNNVEDEGDIWFQESITSLDKSLKFGGKTGDDGSSSSSKSYPSNIHEDGDCILTLLIVKNNFDYDNLIDFFNKPESEILEYFLKIYDQLTISHSLEFIIRFYKDKKDWLQSGYNHAIKIIEEVGKENIVNNNLIFSSGDSFLTKIYNDAKKLTKEEGLQLNNDKWNPSDIWIYNKNSKIYKQLFNTKFDSIYKLNSLILKGYKKKSIYPISLKKSSTDAPIRYYNNKVKNDFKINKVEINLGVSKISNENFFWKSKKGIVSKKLWFILNDDYFIEARSFNNKMWNSMQFELTGLEAKVGKISINSTIPYLNKFGNLNENKNTIYKDGLNDHFLNSNFNDHYSDGEFTDEFIEIIAKSLYDCIYKNNGAKYYNRYDYEEIIDSLKSYTYNEKDVRKAFIVLTDLYRLGIFSKKVMEMDIDKISKFFNGIIKHSESNTKFSSFFIKIGK